MRCDPARVSDFELVYSAGVGDERADRHGVEMRLLGNVLDLDKGISNFPGTFCRHLFRVLRHAGVPPH